LLPTAKEIIVTITLIKAKSSNVLIVLTSFLMYCPDVAEVKKEKRNTAYRLVSLQFNYTNFVFICQQFVSVFSQSKKVSLLQGTRHKIKVTR
jgi:hypothetical protein